MNVQIIETLVGPHGRYFQASCENVSAFVSIHAWGIQVCCQNSSHKVWRKAGRMFETPEKAIEHYKSSEMKNIISAAISFKRSAGDNP